jgi:hypothetical protein
MWCNFIAFLVSVVVIYCIFEFAPTLSMLHPVNWMLSYCATALVIAALYGLVLELLR